MLRECKYVSVLLLLITVLYSTSSMAQNTQKIVSSSGDIAVVAIPVAAFISTLVIKDYTGTKQLVLSGATALAATYALKYAIRKPRPDGSNNLSFPSAHTSVSFSGATFLQYRYGWKVGVPAYLLSTYVAWSRVYVKKHDIWDVAAGALLGVGSSFIFTTPFAKKHQLVISPSVFSDSMSSDVATGLYVGFTF